MVSLRLDKRLETQKKNWGLGGGGVEEGELEAALPLDSSQVTVKVSVLLFFCESSWVRRCKD